MPNPAPAPGPRPLKLNEPNFRVAGSIVHIQVMVDRAGLQKLRGWIDALERVIDDEPPEESAGGAEDEQ